MSLNNSRFESLYHLERPKSQTIAQQVRNGRVCSWVPPGVLGVLYPTYSSSSISCCLTELPTSLPRTWLSRGMQLLSRGMQLLSRGMQLLSRVMQLLSRGMQLLSRVMQLLSRVMQLLSRGMQLLFTDDGVEGADVAPNDDVECKYDRVASYDATLSYSLLQVGCRLQVKGLMSHRMTTLEELTSR